MAIGGAFALYFKLRRSLFMRFYKVGVVKDIICYPVISCKGIHGPNAQCKKFGIVMVGAMDREFVLATEDNPSESDPPEVVQFYSNVMDDIQACADGHSNLILNKTGLKEIRCTIPQHNDTTKIVAVKCGGDTIVEAIKCGEKNFSQDLQSYTGTKQIGLYRIDYTNSEKFVPIILKAGYVIMSESSLEEINDMFRIEPAAKMEVFRPNIIISDTKAFDEDEWLELRIGKHATFNVVGAYLRMIKSPYDIEADEWRNEAEPHGELEGAICIPASCESPAFGVYATLEKDGNIEVGDPVYVMYKPTWFRSLLKNDK